MAMFLIRRDPRDLSRIYVDLPEQEGYLEVSYRILSHPAISLFEHRIALKRLKDAGINSMFRKGFYLKL